MAKADEDKEERETPSRREVAKRYLDLWDRNMSLLARHGPPIPTDDRPER